MNPATVKLIVLAVALVVAAAGGWTARGWKADADQLDAVTAEAERHAKNTEALAAALQDISLVRESERQQAAVDRLNYQRRINHARKERTPLAECQPSALPDPAARPDVVLTRAFVGLWNDALDIGLPASLGAGRPESPGTGAGLPTLDEILDNLAANAEACNQLRSRALTCKAYVERLEALT